MPGSTGGGAHQRGGKKKASTVLGVGEGPRWAVHSLQDRTQAGEEQEFLCRDYSRGSPDFPCDFSYGLCF